MILITIRFSGYNAIRLVKINLFLFISLNGNHNTCFTHSFENNLLLLYVDHVHMK